MGGGGGGVTLIFLLLILSRYVMVRLHSENQLHSLPGSTLKVCLGGWMGGGG